MKLFIGLASFGLALLVSLYVVVYVVVLGIAASQTAILKFQPASPKPFFTFVGQNPPTYLYITDTAPDSMLVCFGERTGIERAVFPPPDCVSLGSLRKAFRGVRPLMIDPSCPDGTYVMPVHGGYVCAK